MFMKRFIIEFGYGLDLHGQDVTKAAKKAVEDAISHSCLSGLDEICNINLNDIVVNVTVAVSRPEEIDEEVIKSVLPIGEKYVKAIKGGMKVSGLNVPAFGDKDDSIEAAIACITVYIR